MNLNEWSVLGVHRIFLITVALALLTASPASAIAAADSPGFPTRGKPLPDGAAEVGRSVRDAGMNGRHQISAGTFQFSDDNGYSTKEDDPI